MLGGAHVICSDRISEGSSKAGVCTPLDRQNFGCVIDRCVVFFGVNDPTRVERRSSKASKTHLKLFELEFIGPYADGVSVVGGAVSDCLVDLVLHEVFSFSLLMSYSLLFYNDIVESICEGFIKERERKKL